MSFLSRLFKRSHPSKHSEVFTDWGVSAGTDAGVDVTEDNALAYSTVYACVTLLSETVASLPLNVYQHQEDGGRRRATDHPLYHILHNTPNNYMTSMMMRESLMGHLLLWGNAYAQITFGGDGSVRDIFPFDVDKIEVRNDNGKVVYHNTDDNKIYTPNQILHVAGFGFNGLVGKSPISFAREAVGLGLSIQKFGSKFFGSGTNPGAIFEYPSKLSGDALKNLRKSLSDAHEGIGNSHKAMILEDGMTFKPIGVPPEDAQFLESRKFQRNEICSIYKVPPHLIGDLERATFSNIEHQAIQFVTHTVRPWLVRWEQELNRKLFNPTERAGGYYVEHNVDGLLRGDAAARGDFYTKLWQIGAISLNEVREKENMNPVEGGDEHFVPLNFVPLSMAGKAQEQVQEEVTE